MTLAHIRKLIASPRGEVLCLAFASSLTAVATTDSRGRALVVLSTKPKRLDFVRPGWIVTPTTTFRDGQVLHDSPDPKVWMVPAPK